MDNFPLKDLMRRKLQTFLTILNLSICISMTTFFILLGMNLGASLSFVTSKKLTEGLSIILSRFTFIVAILNSLVGILVTSFLISITITERIRDIGIMKAVGCLTDMVFAHFTTELLLITLTGCISGTILGVIANHILFWLLSMVGFHLQLKPVNPWMPILIFFLFLFLTNILGIWQIIKTIRIKPVDALSQIFPLKTTHRSGLWIPSKLGFTNKIALRTLLRRRSQTIQLVLCLTVILTLMTISICGGNVAKETSQKYVERALGRDVILIAKADIASQYVNLLSKFFETKQAEKNNYLDKKYSVPDSITSDIGSMEGIMKVDSRLILETTLHEYPKVVPDPESPDGYITIGDQRTCHIVVIGLHPNQVVNDWFMLGRKLEETDVNSALIGDSVALKTFDNPLKQFFKIFNSEFNVVGICIDPLNNGEVIYVPFPTLSSLIEEYGYNLLLLQIDSSNKLETLRKIEAKINEIDLVMLDLNEVLNKHIRFLDYTWSIALSLSFSSLLNAVFCLWGYMTLSLMNQRRDLGIMRALGAKPSKIIKVVLMESVLLVLTSAMIGIPTGLLITFVFFIPEAVISQASMLLVTGLILLVLSVVSLSGISSAINITKEPTFNT